MFRTREATLIAGLGLMTALLSSAPGVQGAPRTGERPAPQPTRRPAPQPTKRTAASTPPDVRRGEPYDGRAPAADPAHGLRAVPRTLLFIPRVAVTLLSRATVGALDWLQRSGVGPFLHRVCFAADGRLVTLPMVTWEHGLTPKAGVSLTTNLLAGSAHRAALHAEAAAGHRRTWHAALQLHPLGLPDTTRRAPFGLSLSARYGRRHDRPFFGRGYVHDPAGPDSDALRARYDSEIFTADAALRMRLWRTLALHLAVGADWRRVNDSVMPTAATTPATADRLDAMAEDLLARQDTFFTARADLTLGGPLDRPVPPVGIRAHLRALARLRGAQGGYHLELDGGVEGFAGLWGDHRRLGLRARIRAVVPLDDQPVGLMHLVCVGGPVSMRGFLSGRLCGESVMAFTASYHQALGPRLWLSLFVDWGGAFREGFIDGEGSGVDVAGGAALALRITRLNWMRLQVAGSRDGVAVFFGWSGTP